MKTFELENLGIAELNFDEKETTNGGCDSTGLCPTGVVAAVGSFFSGVASGIAAGWSAFKL